VSVKLINKAQDDEGVTGPVKNNVVSNKVYPSEPEESTCPMHVIVTNITLTSKAGSKVVARADVEIRLDIGAVKIFGLSVIDVHDKPPWVGFPSKKGNTAGKYFPVVEVAGDLKITIVNKVFEAYDKVRIGVSF
jgi:hypothetical protein